MRVITGSAKGRLLKMPAGKQTRPAMDKVKGATFNIISSLVPNAKVLDLFAGAGNLGIEALSRGALLAVFVDNSRECTKTIKENLELTKLAEKARVYTCDCLKFVQNQSLEPFDIVFCDPPYLKGLLEPLLKSIPQCKMFNHGTLFIIERQKKDALLLETMPEYTLLDERFFGSTALTFFKLKTSEEP